MRLKLTLDIQKPIPFSYHYYLQAVIYHALDERISYSLHNDGYGVNNYKMFTFSELKGKYRVVSKQLQFIEPVYFYITSISPEFLNSLYVTFSNNPFVRLGNQICQILDIEALNDDIVVDDDCHYIFDTLSPITAYQSDETGYTHYFHPESDAFKQSITNNLSKKYKALGKEDTYQFFDIISITNIREFKVKYKDIVYIAYTCRIEARVSNGYLKLLMHSGLGAKNSAGFGMVRIYK